MPKTATKNRVNRKKSTIYDVVILQRDSVNGVIYEDDAIDDVIRLVNEGNGHRINMGHKRGAGDYPAGVGKAFDAYRGEDGKAYAKEVRLKPNGAYTQQILDDAESDDFNDDLALSIEVIGNKFFKYRLVDGKRSVYEISKLRPLALVADGGTNDGLFEQSGLFEEDIETMKINNTAELRAAYPEHVATIENETKTKVSAENEESFQAEKKTLVDRIAELETELTTVKAERDVQTKKAQDFIDAAATDEKVEAIKAKAEEKGVPVGALSEEVYQELADGRSDELIEQVLDGAVPGTAKGYGGGLPAKGKYQSKKLSATQKVLAKHKTE